MSEGTTSMTILGALAGFVVTACLGTAMAWPLAHRLAQQRSAGWNLVPVVVAAVDIEADTVVTMEMISQRSVPEQFVTSSIVKPDSAAYVVNQKTFGTLRQGDPLLWSNFELGTGSAQDCAAAADAAAASTSPGSPEVQQVLGALHLKARPAAAPKHAPGAR